jgi:hypothetical protein
VAEHSPEKGLMSKKQSQMTELTLKMTEPDDEKPDKVSEKLLECKTPKVGTPITASR